MKVALGYRALRWAAALGLLSLALMIWGVIDPRPISLVVAMSIGQGLGTVAFVAFCLVVVNDLIRSGVFSTSGKPLSSAPPAAESEAPSDNGRRS
jgi:hypothetical protein